jgi:tetratricopeptide (TPR) repeat protein
MGSSKKNASKSKACAPPVEGVGVCDVELKVAEEQAVETPAVQTPKAEAPATEIPPIKAPASETHSPEVIDKSASGPELFDKPVEPAAPSPKLSLHASAIPLSLKPEMSIEWPFTRKRQVFNVFYFGLISLQLLALAKTGAAPWVAYPCLAFVGLLTTASVFYLFNHRHHQSSADEFSPRVRRSLRAIGLLVPAFLMFALVRTEPPIPDTQNVLDEMGLPPLVGGSFAREMTQGKRDFKRHRYNDALSHFENAARLDPNSDVAFAWVAETNDSIMNLSPAFDAAMHAIDLNPNNEQAHVVAAHYYNVSGQYEKAKEFAQRAISLNPEDGEAYGYLSQAYNGLGDPVSALPNDNLHVKWHYYEHRAYEQRADTLDRLGRHSEASYVRELAKKVREVGVR